MTGHMQGASYSDHGKGITIFKVILGLFIIFLEYIWNRVIDSASVAIPGLGYALGCGIFWTIFFIKVGGSAKGARITFLLVVSSMLLISRIRANSNKVESVEHAQIEPRNTRIIDPASTRQNAISFPETLRTSNVQSESSAAAIRVSNIRFPAGDDWKEVAEMVFTGLGANQYIPNEKIPQTVKNKLNAGHNLDAKYPIFFNTHNLPEGLAIEKKETSPSRHSSEPLTLVDLAAIDGQVDLMISLKNNGANINHSIGNEMTPLHYAVYFEQFNVMEWLISNGVDVNTPSPRYGSPLLLALEFKRYEAMVWLHRQGADINIRKPLNGETPLHIAAKWGYFEAIKWLIDQGAELNAECTFNNTPLLIAAWSPTHNNKLVDYNSLPWRRQIELMRLLCEKGANVNHTDRFGRTVAHIAAHRDWMELLELLHEFNADFDVADHRGTTPLGLAIQYQKVRALDFLNSLEQ